MPKKLAIITTHPIQYYAPVFQLLNKHFELKVFYTWGDHALAKYDRGFNKKVVWDIPLLNGYDYEFLENTAKDKGTHHFSGIVNPDIIFKIRGYHPDAILVYGWAWKSHLEVLRKFKGKIPIFFRGDSTILNRNSGLKDILRSLFLKWVYYKIDVAFYVGSNNKNYYINFGLQDQQLIFAPHAIDNERFAEDRSEEVLSLRNQLKIRIDEILILFAGKLEPTKNPDLLLQAFLELDLPNTHLLFVGNGKLEKSLKLRAEKFVSDPPPAPSKGGHTMILKERIHFMNFQNQTQMPVVYQACDLFCLPSKSETWGLSVNEAMAAGKAILVSDMVGCSVDLVDETNGAIFKNNDLANLKQKLIALSKSKSHLVVMGIESSNKIKEWSFVNQVEAIVNYVNG